MRWIGAGVLFLLGCTWATAAAPKVHVIAFGKWMTAQWYPETGLEKKKPVTLKIRPVVVDGRVKEYLTGSAHDITDRVFVVRRVFRVNDGLAEDSAPRWQWHPERRRPGR